MGRTSVWISPQREIMAEESDGIGDTGKSLVQGLTESVKGAVTLATAPFADRS